MTKKTIQQILDEQKQTSKLHNTSEVNINRTIANKVKATDVEWLKANRIGAKKAGATRAKSKDWHDSLREGAVRRQQTVEGKQHIKNMCAGSTGNNDWRKNHSLIQKERYKDIKNNPNYKGPVIGINVITGEKIVLKGEAEIKNAGFSCGNISECISGRRKTHKGYTWSR